MYPCAKGRTVPALIRRISIPVTNTSVNPTRHTGPARAGNVLPAVPRD